MATAPRRERWEARASPGRATRLDRGACVSVSLQRRQLPRRACTRRGAGRGADCWVARGCGSAHRGRHRGRRRRSSTEPATARQTAPATATSGAHRGPTELEPARRGLREGANDCPFHRRLRTSSGVQIAHGRTHGETAPSELDGGHQRRRPQAAGVPVPREDRPRKGCEGVCEGGRPGACEARRCTSLSPLSLSARVTVLTDLLLLVQSDTALAQSTDDIVEVYQSFCSNRCV